MLPRQTPISVAPRVLFAFVVLLSPLTPVAAQVSDVDAVVPCADGATAVVMCYGQHADCLINFPADVDFFRFQGVAGDVVRLSAGSTAASGLDPQIEVRDSINMTVFGPTNCDSGCCGTCIATGEFILPATDFYTIVVNDAGNTEGGSYTLHLERMLPQYPVHSLVYAAAPHALSIGHQGDHDFVTFEGETGSNVQLLVNGASAGIDPRVEIFDPTGAPLTSNPTASCDAGCCGTCNFPVNIASLPSDGTYTVAVTDNGRTEGGNIQVSLQCFFSPPPSVSCPNATVDGPVGASYCTSNPNSTGNPATISGYGTTSVAANRLWLLGDDLPIGQTGIFFAGQNQLNPPLPLGLGLRCIGSPLYRFPVSLTCAPGTVLRKLDLTNLPYIMTAIPGQTWNFQFWYRDGVSITNTTDGLTLTFQ